VFNKENLIQGAGVATRSPVFDHLFPIQSIEEDWSRVRLRLEHRTGKAEQRLPHRGKHVATRKRGRNSHQLLRHHRKLMQVACIRVLAPATTKTQSNSSSAASVSAPRSPSPLPHPAIVIMGTLVKKLKVDVRRGIVTPPTTISKRARDSSDEDHTTAEPPTKKRWIASSKSAASKRASIDNLDCDNVPDVPEADLLALEQVWRQAKRMKSAQPVSSPHLPHI
jgi:hypothetical protein